MTSLVELFEPKLPPINLWCLPSASWFYRNKPLVFPEKRVQENRESFNVVDLYNKLKEHR